MLHHISTDPILNFYESLLKLTQEKPEFSEIFLRLAFKEVLGKSELLSTKQLELYRKLLVLKYSQQYPTMAIVEEIMKACFSAKELYLIINSEAEILNEWQMFLEEEMQAE